MDDRITIKVTGPRSVLLALGRFVGGFSQTVWEFPGDVRGELVGPSDPTFVDPSESEFESAAPDYWFPELESKEGKRVWRPTSLLEYSAPQAHLIRLLNRDQKWLQIAQAFRSVGETFKFPPGNKLRKIVSLEGRDESPDFQGLFDVDGIGAWDEVSKVYDLTEACIPGRGWEAVRYLLVVAHDAGLKGDHIKEEFFRKRKDHFLRLERGETVSLPGGRYAQASSGR